MALLARTVWEVRPTAGSDLNGGFFDPSVTSPGTDYSQQDAFQEKSVYSSLGALYLRRFSREKHI